MILGNMAYWRMMLHCPILLYDDMFGSHLWYFGCIPSHGFMILKLHCSILYIDDELLLTDAYGVDHVWFMIVIDDYHGIFEVFGLGYKCLICYLM